MDIQEKKDQELFERISSEYAKKDIVPSSAYARKQQVLSAVAPLFTKLPKAMVLLEVACGIAATVQHLRGRYERYIGVDYSEKLIEIARKFNADSPNVQFEVLNVKDIATANIPNADCVLTTGSLHHFTEIDAILEAIKTKALPGAYFVAIEPQSGNPLIQMMRFIRGKIDPSYSEDQRFFSKKEFEELFRAHGFTEIEFHYHGYVSPPFAQVVMYPQFIFLPLSEIAVACDAFLDRYLPRPLKILSWNIIIIARFPS